MAGFEPEILSAVREPSPQAKAVFLHRAIPGATSHEPDALIDMRKVGDAYGYAEKVYGRADAPCSWEKFSPGELPAWRLERAYQKLWLAYSGVIKEVKVDARLIPDLLDDYRYVVNTAPAWKMCGRGYQHEFPTRKTLILGSAPVEVKANSMVYNGDPSVPWMRASDLFWMRSTEYPGDAEIAEARPGIKVLPTTCDCHPTMIRAGRWGTWTPGVLVHHAYERVAAILQLEAAA
jgi:hypothetical protein